MSGLSNTVAAVGSNTGGLASTLVMILASGAGETGLPQPAAPTPSLMSAPPAAEVFRNFRRSIVITSEYVRERADAHEAERAPADHEVRQRQVLLVELAVGDGHDRAHHHLCGEADRRHQHRHLVQERRV